MYNNSNCEQNSSINIEVLLTLLILIVAIGSFFYDKENYDINKDNLKVNEHDLQLGKEMLDIMKGD